MPQGKGDRSGPATDRRREKRRDERRLVAIVAAFLVFVGALTVTLVYGVVPATLGFVCLLAGAAVLLLVWAVLSLIEYLAR